VRASSVPDHIDPLAKGGTEDGLVLSPNIRRLGDECHITRTAEQFGFRKKRSVALDGWSDDPRGAVKSLGSAAGKPAPRRKTLNRHNGPVERYSTH
jgi:hypothetical protein